MHATDGDSFETDFSINPLPAPQAHYHATTCWGGHSGEVPAFTPAELEIVPVMWADVPLDTWAGRVWTRTITRGNTRADGGCDSCPLLDLCREQVADGGYCGCEKVMVGELMV